jgi:hypothetical protein
MVRAGRGYSVHKSEALVSERDAKRLVNAVIVFHTLYYCRPTGLRSTKFMRTKLHNTHTVRRKNLTIRDDQAEWVEENHLNLSSFLREKLDELIEERE